SLSQTREARDHAKDAIEALEKNLKVLMTQRKELNASRSAQERSLQESIVQAREKTKVTRAKVADLERRILYGTNLVADLNARIATGKDECPFSHPVSREHLLKDQARIEGTVKRRRSEYELAALDLSQVENATLLAERALENFLRNSGQELVIVETQIARLET